MDPAPLMRVLARLHERAGDALELHIKEAMGGQQVIDATVTLAICGDVLVSMAGGSVHEAVLSYRERVVRASMRPRERHEPPAARAVGRAPRARQSGP